MNQLRKFHADPISENMILDPNVVIVIGPPPFGSNILWKLANGHKLFVKGGTWAHIQDQKVVPLAFSQISWENVMLTLV